MTDAQDAVDRPDWFEERQQYIRDAMDQGWPIWRVCVTLDCRSGEQVFDAHAPHRAGAKKRVVKLLDDECQPTDWGRTYLPRDYWDCPNCGGNDSMVSVPNMRGKWDWDCTRCSFRTIGHPQDPRIENGRGSDRYV